MEIRSGTTRERLVRTLIFLLLLSFFAAYFAYDGWHGYPAKNVKWARQAMPDSAPEKIQFNPRVIGANLTKITDGLSVDKVREILGEPTMVQPRQALFVGRKIEVVVSLDEQETVLSVKTDKIDASQKRTEAGGLVTEKRVQKIEKGMPFSKVRLELGSPAEEISKALWYVGPAAYARISVDDNKVAQPPLIEPSKEYTEGDIRLQKVIAVVLGALSVIFLFHLVRVSRTRAVLDDRGVTLNRKHIPFDAMQRLEADEYKDKGWVDLVYRVNGGEQTRRIDSYHYARFDDIVNAICQKKAWPLPFHSETGSAASADDNMKNLSADDIQSANSSKTEKE